MELAQVSHITDNILTESEARMTLTGSRLLVRHFTNITNKQSVVHSHPYHEIVLPLDGSIVRYAVNGSVYMVGIGEVAFFPAQTYHAGKYDIDAAFSERLVIQIDDTLWQAARRHAKLLDTDWMHSVTVLDAGACSQVDLRGLFLRMASASELPARVRDVLQESETTELEMLFTLITGSGRTAAASSTSALVARAAACLQSRYQDPSLTTSTLAQELYVSREHLSRAFKECTTESIHSYLTNLRMQHCRRALAGGASVLDACTESGFPDYSSFLKTFRRLYGVTPAEFRSTARAAADTIGQTRAAEG